jgi:flagellar assembly protein FliH
MPLLKAQHTLGGGGQKVRESPIVMDLADLEREAGEMLARARAQASKIVAEARSEAQRETVRIREDARIAGHQEGLQAGLAQGRQKGQEEAFAGAQQQIRDLTARWSQTLELLHQHMPAHVADARTDLIRLALAIAGRVTRQEALRNRRVAPALVEETLRMVGATRKVAIHVSPVEMDLLRSYLPELQARIRSIESVELVPDQAVGAGGCVLRFGAGEVDARIELQLARIAEELLGVESPMPPPEDAEGDKT